MPDTCNLAIFVEIGRIDDELAIEREVGCEVVDHLHGIGRRAPPRQLPRQFFEQVFDDRIDAERIDEGLEQFGRNAIGNAAKPELCEQFFEPVALEQERHELVGDDARDFFFGVAQEIEGEFDPVACQHVFEQNGFSVDFIGVGQEREGVELATQAIVAVVAHGRFGSGFGRDIVKRIFERDGEISFVAHHAVGTTVGGKDVVCLDASDGGIRLDVFFDLGHLDAVFVGEDIAVGTGRGRIGRANLGDFGCAHPRWRDLGTRLSFE